MQYVHLGNSGLIVSRIAFGTMTLGQGTLVGELKTNIDQHTADQMIHKALDAGEVVSLLDNLAKKYRATIPQIAISWILSKSYVSTVIIGANKMNQLEDNLGASNVSLKAEDIESLDTLTATITRYPEWMQPMGWDQKVTEGIGN